MKIEIEPLASPQVYFAEVRDLLIRGKTKFDEVHLHLIPYSQLNLCCIGNAGTAACLPELVKKEKGARRERFLNLESSDFKEVTTYLKIEQMYADVMYAIANRAAPHWSTLNGRQALWARLTCLYNHVDNPLPRIQLTVDDFLHCAKDDTCGLPGDVCGVYATKLKGMASVYPGTPKRNISDNTFRDKIREMADTLRDFMTEEERHLIEKEQLQGYSCTSDCFRVLA
jgi:hypothetical protein